MFMCLCLPAHGDACCHSLSKRMPSLPPLFLKHMPRPGSCDRQTERRRQTWMGHSFCFTLTPHLLYYVFDIITPTQLGLAWLAERRGSGGEWGTGFKVHMARVCCLSKLPCWQLQQNTAHLSHPRILKKGTCLFGEVGRKPFFYLLPYIIFLPHLYTQGKAC